MSSVSKQLQSLCDTATEAHERIQKNHKQIDPIVGVNQRMRESGYPADIMTIDCLKTEKRIILILHDDKADTVSYQFSYMDKDPAEKFEQIALVDLTSAILYDWMARYFARSESS